MFAVGPRYYAQSNSKTVEKLAGWDVKIMPDERRLAESQVSHRGTCIPEQWGSKWAMSV